MPRDYPRSYRVADQIQRELADLIAHELKDPGVDPLLTISEVEVTRDLSVATVYYSLMQDEQAAATQQALDRASGFLRRQLAARVRLRAVPQLRFRHDRSGAEGARLDALIAAARRRDRADGDSDG